MKKIEFKVYINNPENNNEIIFKFYNEDERNVSHCYNVIADYGTVDISVRYITITTGSAQKKYDGEELFCKEFTTESNYEEPNNFGIGPNDKGEITNFTSVSKPGIYSNELKIKIVNEENKDVKDVNTEDPEAKAAEESAAEAKKAAELRPDRAKGAVDHNAAKSGCHNAQQKQY